MSLLRAFLALFKRQKKIEVIRREETTITLDEWRSTPDLVKIAQSVWSNPDFRLMISCLKNESPAYFVLPDDASPGRSVAIQRRCEGYNFAINNLEAMRTLRTVPEPLESTFEPEETESKEL